MQPTSQHLIMKSQSQQQPFKVEDTVVYRGTRCIVRFIGETQFAPKIWVGIELPTADGKNTGSVAGVEYVYNYVICR